ncbi:MAG: nucleotidyl transferase AbiEii/AbiGii toxin family protein, partial [Bryobacterales bacterium]|nr:nucleotidyl transferase AbiEii/AbiGii toxin family protein [Bryobacterales bacterium]
MKRRLPMGREARNVAASVRARLQNVARTNRASFERVLTRYALERLLFRLSASPHKERFVLKGAMLYAAWLDDPFRTTRDLDLLASGQRQTERIVKIFAEICVQEVLDDGLTFDAERIAAKPIRGDLANAGLRLRTAAHLAGAVIPLWIDIGFGDVVTPGPVELEDPSLLDQPP